MMCVGGPTLRAARYTDLDRRLSGTTHRQLLREYFMTDTANRQKSGVRVGI